MQAKATTLVLVPGKPQFVDLKGSKYRFANRIDRARFRAGVEVLRNPPAHRPCVGVAATVEILDATGRTSIGVEHPQQFCRRPVASSGAGERPHARGVSRGTVDAKL